MQRSSYAAFICKVAMCAAAAGVFPGTPAFGKAGASASAGVTLESVRTLSEINQTFDADAFPFISGDGLRMHYVSSSNYLRVASRTSRTAQFGAPADVGGLSSYRARGCWLTPDERTIYFVNTSGVLCRAERDSRTSSFSTPVSITLSGSPTGFISAPSLTPDQSELFLFHSPTSGDSIIRFTRSSSTSYTYAGKVAAFSRGGVVGPGQLSKDGLRFYVPVKTPADELRAYSRASATAAWDTGMVVATTTRVVHPSVTADESTIVFAFSSDNGWTNHDLYEGQLTWASTLRLVAIPSPTYNRRPTFAWRPAEGASQYTLQIANNADFMDPIVALPTADTAYTPVVDLPIGPIHWRVRSLRRPYSSSSFVLLDDRIPILVPYRPEMTLERRPTLRWRPVAGASSYTLAIYTGGSGTHSEESFETGDFSRQPWTHSGNAGWTVRSADDAYHGTYSARSGAIANSQSTILQVTKTCIAGSISFYRRVSSESGYDYLSFYIDDTLKDSWSGSVSWSRVSYPVAAGTHTFQWRYSKDGSTSTGSDAAWIDQIRFPANDPTLVLTLPVSDTVYQCTADLPVGRISWKVKSNLVDTYSEPDAFEILTDTIPFLYRFSGDTIDSRRPRFRWHPVPGATTYTIALSVSSDFTSPLLVLPAPDTTYAPTFDLANGAYYWKVSSNRNGVYATPDQFVVEASVSASGARHVLGEEACGFRLLNGRGTPMVSFRVMPGQTPVLDMYTQDGRLVYRTCMRGSSGVVDLGAAQLPGGSYVAVMKAGDAVYTRRTLFVK